GTPGLGASSIASFDVFVSDNSGPFTIFRQGTALTSAQFTGAAGHTYGFFSVATDNLRNRQPTPTAAQAPTTIGDITAPTWPAGSLLQAISVQTTSVTLSWTAAQDDVGVTGYRVFQGTSQVGSTASATRTFQVNGLTAGTTYNFKVEAVDAVGNL